MASSIAKDIKKINTLKNKIRTALKKEIEALPGNPNIKILSDSPRIFTMESKHFTNVNWSPESYDYKSSHMTILRYLESGNEENIIIKLQNIIDTGKVPGQQGNLNPEVIKQLKRLI
jgi:hypothetical protein